MKRILALALALTLLLCGCGGKEDKGGNNTHTTQPAETQGINLNGVKLLIGGVLSDEDKANLGQPVSTAEAPSCMYEGMDVIYEYDGFTLQTNQQSEDEIVCIVTITDPAYKTDKGVKIGDTADAVKKAYGAATEGNNYYLVYAKEGFETTFNLSDGAVEEIVYAAVK